jgi:CheY-like chemotaxis protein/anti-sigma regulatory factor (Ser/Thr protein kinase)
VGDAARLSQVVGNLLQNAAKFTDRGGQVDVRLTVESEHGQAVLVVQDTGIGIDPEMLPHVFKPFAQSDRSLDRSAGGLGLGLALVKGLVDLHQGAVRARSEGVGRGAEFTIRLPLAQQPAADKAATGTAAPVGPIRVLIVEDNRDAAETLRDLLEMSGCTVAVADSGPGALALGEPFQSEVVLCDLGLPGMDGYQVAKALRRNPVTARARLIALSGYGQEEDERRSREAGFDLHLTKPVDFDELQRLLEVSSERRPKL